MAQENTPALAEEYTVVILYLGGDIGKNNLAAKAPTNILQRDLHHDPPFLL